MKKKKTNANDKPIIFSTSELTERIVGKRPVTNSISFDQPCELGYHCPVCKYKSIVKGEFDERLHWSEYNGFVWCRKCNKDYPGALCQPDIDKAIGAYLLAVLDAQRMAVANELIHLHNIEKANKS